MPKEVAISVRMPSELAKRAEALVAPMNKDTRLTTITGGTVKRATVLRMALLRGIEALEQEYTPSPDDPENNSSGG